MARILLLALTLVLAITPDVAAQVVDAERLTTTAFATLDRSRTAVIVPGGILEQHGPHLPSGSDTYQARWLADALARDIAARPGWTALMMPMIPLGHSGANDIPRQFIYPATLTIRAETLRAIYMDLGDALGEHGFKYVFLVHIHGAPTHNQMLDQAAAYFRDTWGGAMVHLMGLKSVNERAEEPLSPMPEAARADGFTVHAGLSESSRVLFTRPDTIDRGLFSARPLAASSFADLVRLGYSSAWTGYWGAPAASTAALGAALMVHQSSLVAAVASAVLDGRPWAQDAFFVEASTPPEDRAVSRDIEARERQLVARQRSWLKARGLE